MPPLSLTTEKQREDEPIQNRFRSMPEVQVDEAEDLERKLSALNKYERERSTSIGRSSIHSKGIYHSMTERNIGRNNSVGALHGESENVNFGLLASNVK